jgi:putative FmdB family regulatory protein
MTYEYECIACNHQWEAEQSIKDNPLTTCPACKQETAKRLISKSSFILTGSGWAKDNYAK